MNIALVEFKIVQYLCVWNSDQKVYLHTFIIPQISVLLQRNHNWNIFYRVSHKSVYTLFLLFSQLLEHIQRNFWPLFNSPGNLLHYSHLNFKIWFWISLDNWGQSWHPSFRNWHLTITMRQNNNFSVTGGNFDLNYLSYF